MSKLENKIEANDRTIIQVLNEQKYTVDYFQREYNWEKKHIEQLVTDLTSSFLNEYTPGDPRTKGADYNNYYLGPFVVSEKSGKRSIIDGQQRLTSITLLLIFLNNLQQKLGITETLEPLIFSEVRGTKSFNIQVEERVHCLESLFTAGEYTTKDDDDDSTINMAERYEDIATCFPDEINVNNLPYFLDWLKYNVVFVEIIAHSDDNAYTIFETMNDRGLNLTSTEMLKGFVLSRFDDPKSRQKANANWKKAVQELNGFEKDEDLRFFQCWLRAKYAESIRPGKAGSKNEDFEKIGTRFHAWVRDNLSKMELDPQSSSDFEGFITNDFEFFKNVYIRILEAEKFLSDELEHVYYIKRWGIAASLSYPLMLSPLNLNDSKEVVGEKLNLVARFIETFVVLRSINFRKFASSSIRYTMYSLVKEIRGLEVDPLRGVLAKKIADMDEKWDGMAEFRMHGQNKRFTKFLLSRITAFVDRAAGVNSTFQTYYDRGTGKPFEIEHIWANKHERHLDEFDQKSDFEEFRNRIGCLVLLPNGTNQSFGDKPYPDKLKHYARENLLVSSLSELTYRSNPNFTSAISNLNLPFVHHDEFKKSDVVQRQKLYQTICETIWSV